MSIPLPADDPAQVLLREGLRDPSKRSTTTVHDPSCYICTDPEFAMMGLPLCKPCPRCSAAKDGEPAGHVPADDVECSTCGFDVMEWHQAGEPADMRGF